METKKVEPSCISATDVHQSFLDIWTLHDLGGHDMLMAKQMCSKSGWVNFVVG